MSYYSRGIWKLNFILNKKILVLTQHWRKSYAHRPTDNSFPICYLNVIFNSFIIRPAKQLIFLIALIVSVKKINRALTHFNAGFHSKRRRSGWLPKHQQALRLPWSQGIPISEKAIVDK